MTMSGACSNTIPDDYVYRKDAEPVVQIPNPAPTSDASPSVFKPTSLFVYAQHSRGLWQPTNGTSSSVFIIMMATRSTVDKRDWNIKDDVTPLVHCATLADARKNLEMLAQQYQNATKVVEDVEHGHHFMIAGKHKTRTVWVKEVGHARSLKMINLDDVDGGRVEDSVGTAQDSKSCRRSSIVPESDSETDGSACVAGNAPE